MKFKRISAAAIAITLCIGSAAYAYEETISGAIAEDEAVTELVADVSPSVVAIVGYYNTGTSQGYGNVTVHGTGVIYRSDGYIITNNHVVENMSSTTVVFSDGVSVGGEVLYTDELADLAVIKVNRNDLKPIKMADEADIVSGRTVIAIGTPISLSMRNTVTKGIISGKDVSVYDSYYKLIQTDAAINPGNSGGPLLNMKGEMVGINSSGYNGYDIENTAFAIPIDTIQYAINSFETDGRIIRPDFGISMEESWEAKIGLPTNKGLTVRTAGETVLMTGDVVSAINGVEVHTITDWNEAIKDTYSGGKADVTYSRGGRSAIATLTAVDAAEDAAEQVQIDTGIKEEELSTISSIDSAKMGDSFYGWMIDNPEPMYVFDREQDGSSTTFIYDYSNYITISVSQTEDDYDYERDFVMAKKSFSDYSLVKAEKRTEGSTRAMEFVARDSENFIRFEYFVTDKYSFSVVGRFSASTPLVMAECGRIMDTFEPRFEGDDIYDLSSVKDDSREYSFDNVGLSMSVPAEYTMLSSEQAFSSFVVGRYNADYSIGSNVQISVYSVSDEVSAKTLSAADHEWNKKSSNSEVYKISDIAEKKYKGFSGYEYEWRLNETGGEPEYVRDVFFEDGGYVYNIAVIIRSGEDSPETIADAILNSTEVDVPDKSELGTLLRAFDYIDETYTVNVDDWSLSLPVSFSENYAYDSMAMYTDELTSVSVAVDTDACFGSAKSYISDIINSIEKSRYSEIVEQLSSERIGGNSYMTAVIKTRSGSKIEYREIFAAVIDGKAIEFKAEYPEKVYSEYNREIVKNIISGLKFTK
ncbi:MAG: serine protease [Clostridia bacterium]|nr:serine protease [Clostridia bacterium]